MQKVAIVGIPWDKKSSYLTGPALAPARIREAFHSDSANSFAENGVSLAQHPLLSDAGDLTINEYFDIETGMAALLAQGFRTLALGGDHSVSFPVLRAQRKHYPKLEILHIDAHGDLYHDFEGDPYSHACPFARIMEEGLADRLVQVGIRTMTAHQREQAKKFGVETIEMKDFSPGCLPAFSGPVYISLDLDALDPAFAPGVSHHEPGGLSTREVLQMIHQLNVPIAGADIVEYNPHRDWQGMTAMVAAKFLREIAAKMVAG